MICADPFCQLPNDGHRHGDVERALSVAKRLYDLHERGPIGVIESHRIARTAFATCPVCAMALGGAA